MNPAYFDDCYINTWDTVVERVKPDKVVLRRSAFYPEGGGQPSDTGFLIREGESFKVKSVEKKGDVWHYLERNGLAEGDKVTAKLDWERRYAHMRMHTAQHLISGIVLEEYDAATTSNQIHADHSRIDFSPFDPDEDDLEFVTQKFNEIVEKEREVKKYIINRESVPEVITNPKRLRLFKTLPKSIKEIRIIEIPGIDKDPCAGTHVDNTGEIGQLNILSTENKGKNTIRINYELL